MTIKINDDLVVSGVLSAANILFGALAINPRANESTAIEVKTNHAEVAPEPTVLLTAHSAYPWTRVQEVGYRFSSQSGFTAFIYRTDETETILHWVSWQGFAG
ncbi:hypothetical protein [Streptomyces sp. CCM_MD2014]|uniref:hypothetical protein n=1 Tax=Streptomyces sp. CCM_MD2014 TaxID=1561022 RepID=UPI00052AD4E4|nr:hypothetical protein [Streptomyces sp. CCM_MD2014]AIV36414.1 hypothetical protein NI25_25495 [Streptomyces sp. CCM_MD2014]